MPRLHTRQELAALADMTAKANFTVDYRGNIYVPVDFETGELQPSSPDRTVWRRMLAEELMRFSNDQLDILFSSPQEFRSFHMMLRQLSMRTSPVEKLLIPIKDQGVKVLTSKGALEDPSGAFTPNYLNLMYDPEVDTEFMWKTLVDWVVEEEQASSLLHQLSVGLQPSWTGSKYLLFIGEGLNGKSTLLKMIHELVGVDNTSNVTRLEMSGRKVTTAALNGALMNIVFDGPREFLKDSSTEKTLIAGERIDLELKYENIATRVQTNALFLEGLNKEPKTSDHSPALQRRLVRYHFPNVYQLDNNFEKMMMSPTMLSALVTLILQHWVSKGEKQTKLLVTEKSKQLQLEHQWSTSPLLQFLEHLAAHDTIELKSAIKQNTPVDVLVALYRPWLSANGYKAFEDGYIRQSVEEAFITRRKTVRVKGKPSTRRVIIGLRDTTQALVDILLKGDDDDKVVRGT